MPSTGWVYIAATLLMSVCGCCTVFADVVYNACLPRRLTAAFPFTLAANYSFLVALLALSLGLLTLTALYRLLPGAGEYLVSSFGKDAAHHGRQIQATVMACYLGGMAACLLINGLIHVMTSQSVVHCAHDGEAGHHETTEETPLVPRPVLGKRQSLADMVHRAMRPENALPSSSDGECMGYTAAEGCHFDPSKQLHFCEHPPMMEQLHEDSEAAEHVHSHGHGHDHDHGPDHDHEHRHDPATKHHHHVQPPLSRLLSISLQTTIAITLHKLPEGFITFVGGQSAGDEDGLLELGFSIFLLLVVHNFVEGFLMTLPLYFSLQSRTKAVLVTGVLSSAAQPLGALAGTAFLARVGRQPDPRSVEYVYGVLMGITAGFLSVVGFQMFGSAILFGGSQRLVLVWLGVGLALILGSYVLAA